MRLYTTDRGIARQGADGHFSLLDLPFDDIGALLRYSDTDTAARASRRAWSIATTYR